MRQRYFGLERVTRSINDERKQPGHRDRDDGVSFLFIASAIR